MLTTLVTLRKGNLNTISRSIKANAQLLAELFVCTKYLEEHYPEATFQQRVFHLVNEPLVKCQFCNSFAKWTPYNKGYFDHCGKKECIDQFHKRSSKRQWESMSTDVKEKRRRKWIESKKKSNIRKHGTEWHSQTSDWREKVKDTIREKFGTEWFMNTPQFNSAREKFTLDGHYRWKLYTFPSGRQVKLQGYENCAVDKLLLTHAEEDILTDSREIESFTGKILYVGKDEKTHRYFPDIYIKSTNTIIEVKSQWTFNVQKELNLLKESRCKEMGMNFEFWIF